MRGSVSVLPSLLPNDNSCNRCFGWNLCGLYAWSFNETTEEGKEPNFIAYQATKNRKNQEIEFFEKWIQMIYEEQWVEVAQVTIKKLSNLKMESVSKLGLGFEVILHS